MNKKHVIRVGMIGFGFIAFLEIERIRRIPGKMGRWTELEV